jgi:hypothetical protein
MLHLYAALAQKERALAYRWSSLINRPSEGVRCDSVGPRRFNCKNRHAGTAIVSVLHATDSQLPGLSEAGPSYCLLRRTNPAANGFGLMIIDDFALVRAIHVLALVHWIGGVAMVTTIVLPHARRLPEAIDAVAAFALLRLRPAYRSWSRAYPESTC